MKGLDLFSGSGSATIAFHERGHEVVGVEIDPHRCRSPPHVLRGDVLDVAQDPLAWLDRPVRSGWKPDHVHGSSPCNAFSVPSIGRMWEKNLHLLVPKHPTAEMGLRLLDAQASIILALSEDNPSMTFTAENPRAMMRRAVAERHPWMGPPQGGHVLSVRAPRARESVSRPSLCVCSKGDRFLERPAQLDAPEVRCPAPQGRHGSGTTWYGVHVPGRGAVPRKGRSGDSVRHPAHRRSGRTRHVPPRPVPGDMPRRRGGPRRPLT